MVVVLDPMQRLCLNGSTGQEVIVRKDLQNVEALTFDPISRLLYWVDAGAQKIEVGLEWVKEFVMNDAGTTLSSNTVRPESGRRDRVTSLEMKFRHCYRSVLFRPLKTVFNVNILCFILGLHLGPGDLA